MASPKYNWGDDVILLEPESVNMAGLVTTWFKIPYQIKEKSYSNARKLWIYYLELDERVAADHGVRQNVVLWGEKQMVPMHKFDMDQYVTWQGRNWVIYKISLHKDMGSDEYKWGYFVKASKWVDNLRLEWTIKELWEHMEGLELATSPDMDNLIGGSLWRSYEPYVYGARFLYHVISLTGRFDDENKVYYEDVTGINEAGQKSMSETRFVTGYVPLRSDRNWGHPKFSKNQTVRINNMLGILGVPERMVITGLDLERIPGGTNGPEGGQWWYRGHLKDQPRTAPYSHGMGIKEEELSAVDELLRSANNNSSSSSSRPNNLEILVPKLKVGEIWEQTNHTVGGQRPIVKIKEITDYYVHFVPWKENGWDRFTNMLNFDSFVEKYRWVERYDFKFEVGDIVLLKSKEWASSDEQFNRRGLVGLSQTERKNLQKLEDKVGSITEFKVIKRVIKQRGRTRAGTPRLELQPLRNSLLNEIVPPNFLIPAPKFKLFDYIKLTSEEHGVKDEMGSVCVRYYRYGQANNKWYYECMFNRDVNNPLTNYSFIVRNEKSYTLLHRPTTTPKFKPGDIVKDNGNNIYKIYERNGVRAYTNKVWDDNTSFSWVERWYYHIVKNENDQGIVVNEIFLSHADTGGVVESKTGEPDDTTTTTTTTTTVRQYFSASWKNYSFRSLFYKHYNSNSDSAEWYYKHVENGYVIITSHTQKILKLPPPTHWPTQSGTPMHERRGIVAKIVRELPVEEKLIINYNHMKRPAEGERWIRNNWMSSRLPSGIRSWAEGTIIQIIQVRGTSSSDLSVLVKNVSITNVAPELLTYEQLKRFFYLEMIVSMHDCIVTPDNDDPSWKDMLNSYDVDDEIYVSNWRYDHNGTTYNVLEGMSIPNVMIQVTDPNISEEYNVEYVDINATDKQMFTFLLRIIDESWRIEKNGRANMWEHLSLTRILDSTSHSGKIQFLIGKILPWCFPKNTNLLSLRNRIEEVDKWFTTFQTTAYEKTGDNSRDACKFFENFLIAYFEKVRFCYYLSKKKRYKEGDMLWGKREFYKEGFWPEEYRFTMIKKVHRMGPWYYYEIDDGWHNSAFEKKLFDDSIYQKHREPYLLYQDIFGKKKVVIEEGLFDILIETDDTYTMKSFIPNDTTIHVRAAENRGPNFQITEMPKWAPSTRRAGIYSQRISVTVKDLGTGQIARSEVFGDVASIWNNTGGQDDSYHSSSGESADDAIADITEEQERMAVSDSASENDDDGYNSSDVDVIRPVFTVSKETVFYWPGFYEKKLVLMPRHALIMEISNWKEPYREIYSQVIDNVIVNTNTFTKLMLDLSKEQAEKISCVRISPTFIVIDDPKKVNGVITQIPLSGHIFLFEDANEEAIYEIYPFQIMIDLGHASNMKPFFTIDYLGLYYTSLKMVGYFITRGIIKSIGTINGTTWSQREEANVINMSYTMMLQDYGLIKSTYVTGRPDATYYGNYFDWRNLLKSLRGYKKTLNNSSEIYDPETTPFPNLVNIAMLTPKDMFNNVLPAFGHASPYFAPLRIGSLWSYNIPVMGSTGLDKTVFGIMVEIGSKGYNPCEKKWFIMRRWVRKASLSGGEWRHMYNSIDSKDLRTYYGTSRGHMNLDTLPSGQIYKYLYLRKTTGSITGSNSIESVTSEDLPSDISIAHIVNITIVSRGANARRQITFNGDERQRRAGNSGSSSMMMTTPENDAVNETNANNKRRANFQSPVPMLETVSEDVKKYREEQTEDEAFLCIICGKPLDIEHLELELMRNPESVTEIRKQIETIEFLIKQEQTNKVTKLPEPDKKTAEALKYTEEKAKWNRNSPTPPENFNPGSPEYQKWERDVEKPHLDKKPLPPNGMNLLDIAKLTREWNTKSASPVPTTNEHLERRLKQLKHYLKHENEIQNIEDDEKFYDYIFNEYVQNVGDATVDLEIDGRYNKPVKLGCGHIFHKSCIDTLRQSLKEGIPVNLRWNSGAEADTSTRHPIFSCPVCRFAKFGHKRENSSRWKWYGNTAEERNQNREKVWFEGPEDNGDGVLRMYTPKRFKIEIINNRRRKIQTKTKGVLDELHEFKNLKLKF